MHTKCMCQHMHNHPNTHPCTLMDAESALLVCICTNATEAQRLRRGDKDVGETSTRASASTGKSGWPQDGDSATPCYVTTCEHT